MFVFKIILCSSLLLIGCMAGLENNSNRIRLPTWISENPAFLCPKVINAENVGDGLIMSSKYENSGWVVELNSDIGYGIEIRLENLTLGTNNSDYLLITEWPISTTEIPQINLFTGNFSEEQRILMLNAKKFFVLFNAAESEVEPKLALRYKRYGISYESDIPVTTDKPIKAKASYEVHLKGKKPELYKNADFIKQLKKAIRETAQAYCRQNKIVFNDSIPTDEMVSPNHINICPFGWPDREICVSFEHSIFVSGMYADEIPGESSTADYELTAAHLKDMWVNGELSCIKELGIVVFKLPEASNVVLVWVTAIGIAAVCSLAVTLTFLRIEKCFKGVRKENLNAVPSEVITPFNKPSRNATLMQKPSGSKDKSKTEEVALGTHSTDNLLNNKSEKKISPRPALQNYFGSILFSNRAFDDEENLESSSTV